VKNAKLGILVCGGLLLVLMLSDHFLDMLKGDAATTLILLVAFAAPTAMGAMAMKKPPMLSWQAIVSVAGFGLAFVKLRMWDIIPHIADIPGIRFKLYPIAIVVGLVFSILALVKPEAKA
jgi:hypothetical protein